MNDYPPYVGMPQNKPLLPGRQQDMDLENEGGGSERSAVSQDLRTNSSQQQQYTPYPTLPLSSTNVVGQSPYTYPKPQQQQQFRSSKPSETAYNRNLQSTRLTTSNSNTMMMNSAASMNNYMNTSRTSTTSAAIGGGGGGGLVGSQRQLLHEEKYWAELEQMEKKKR
jgi:hypothetical protein